MVEEEGKLLSLAQVCNAHLAPHSGTLEQSFCGLNPPFLLHKTYMSKLLLGFLLLLTPMVTM